MKLHLGVNDIPYQMPGADKQTTGDVAVFLERRYAIMATFYELHGDDIGRELESILQVKIDNLLMGAKPSDMIFEDSDLSGIEQMFRDFLDNREMDGRPGVPTDAAVRGVNHRLMRPYLSSNPERPSFIDTGTYQSNFRAWIEE